MPGFFGRCGAAAAIAAVLAGCGHHDGAKDESTPTKADVTTADVVTAAPTATDVNDNGRPDADPSDQDWPGTMRVVYEDALSQDAIRGRKFMKDNNLLPQLADDINSTLKLPFDITLKGSQCDEPNDFWSSSDESITMCYEDATNAIDVFTQLGVPWPMCTLRTRLGCTTSSAGSTGPTRTRPRTW